MSETTGTVRGRSREASVAGPPSKTRKRCTRRAARFAPVLWMLALTMFIVGVGVLPAAGDPVPSTATATIAVTVAQADTLWSIAAAHRLPGVPTADMVRLIKEANSLTGAVVSAGDSLRIPVEALPDTAYAQVSDVSATR